jgi:hypothetical protein
MRANKHKDMNHDRILRADAQLEKKIRKLRRWAETLDAQEAFSC